MGYQGSSSSTLRILKRLRFKYKKANDGRKLPMERSDTVGARPTFHSTLHQFGAPGDNRPGFYKYEKVKKKGCTRYMPWRHKGGEEV
jgi:hypothetical protein